MDDILLAWYMYPEPNGTPYYSHQFQESENVEMVFDYCQILLAYITKQGWEFLVNFYGYENLFELDCQSGWLNCETLEEYKLVVAYHMDMLT